MDLVLGWLFIVILCLRGFELFILMCLNVGNCVLLLVWCEFCLG